MMQASDALAEGLCRENIEREVLSVAGAGKHKEVQDVLDVVDGEVLSANFVFILPFSVQKTFSMKCITSWM
jgi:hypothetical protein